MQSGVANFVLFITDIFICIFAGVAIYGVKWKKVYALGRWYVKTSNKSQYIQVIIGYIMLVILLLFFRFFVYPERLYPYL